MNKKLLLPLLFLLVACNNTNEPTPSVEPSKEITPTGEVTPLVPSEITPTATSPSVEPSTTTPSSVEPSLTPIISSTPSEITPTPTPSVSTPTQSPSPTPTPSEETEVKITFKNKAPTGTLTGENAAGAIEKFVSWFNEENDLLEDVETSGLVQVQNWNQVVCNSFSTLTFGSQKSDGKLVFNFNVEVILIKLVLQSYFKTYQKGSDIGYNIDQSIMTANEEVIELNNNAPDEIPEECEFTIEMNNSKSLILESSEGRVFLHEMIIIY